MLARLATLLLGVTLGASAALSADRAPKVEMIASPAADGARVPNLTLMPDGRVVMSWIEPGADSSLALRCASFANRRWSAPATIAQGESLFANWADFPSVAALGGDRLAAHWLAKRGGAKYAYDVRVSQSEDGGKTWGPAVTPHLDATATEHGFVSLAPDARGVLAVWLDGRKTEGHDEDSPGPTPDMTLRAAVVTHEGQLADQAELDGRVCDCCQTAAARTDRGIVVAYRDRSEKEVRDISVVRFEQDHWTEPATLGADGWNINGCPVNGPALAADGAKVGVVWFTAAADTPRVMVAFSDDAGSTFRPPTRVDEGSPLGRVDVVLLDDGAAFVTWLEGSGKEASIRARRVSRAGTAEPAFTVARTSGARATGFPRVVHSGTSLLIAWTEPGKPSRVRVASLRLE